MQAYKALYLDKAQGTIFGPEAIEEKSGGKKDPDAMEIDEIQKKEGKNTARYVLEKALKTRQNHIILQTVMTNLEMRTNILRNPLSRNLLHWVQAKIKISHLEYG